MIRGRVLQNYTGLIEFDREVNCTEDVLGKQINTIIGGVPVVVIIPEAAKEPDPNNMLDCLVSPQNFPNFNIEWGHVYRRPKIIAGIRFVGIVARLDEDSKCKLLATMTKWREKFESIAFLMMDKLALDQQPLRLDQLKGGGINFHTGLRLFKIDNKSIQEIFNPYNIPSIRANLICEKNCLNLEKFKRAFNMAASNTPISHTYTLLLAAYKAFIKSDFRSAFILGGSAIENSILQKLARYSIEHGIELKIPVGELGRKFDKLKQYSISIPVDNYKTDIISLRNSVVHKGIDFGERETRDYLEKCRTIIDEYEPSIIGYDLI